MTTLLWFAELILNTPMKNNTDDCPTYKLYEGITDQMTIAHYTKWEQIERL